MRNPTEPLIEASCSTESGVVASTLKKGPSMYTLLRLRKVLKPSGRDHIIETVRGLGYRLAA